jgi:PAS domain S-box-containing protein
MLEIFTRLFDPSGFPRRWDCGDWSDELGWLHILSDLAVWSAYVAIPCVQGYFVLTKKDVPFRLIFWLFGAFILACGSTHLMEAIIFWWPAYRLAGVLKLFTAIVSWGTVMALVPATPRALAMRSPAELERRVAERTAELERAYESLRLEVLERRRAERDLQESEEQFRTLADSIPQLAWMARPDGPVFWYNRRWYEFTGTTPEQMLGWGWQSVHDPEELPRVLEGFRAAIAGGEPWEDTFPLRRHDGAMRWHLSRALPIRDERGRVTRWFGTNTDITDRMEMEVALKQTNRQKDEFLAMLAHELRNPLAPIRNALEVLRQAGTPAEAPGEALEMAERQVRHMARLLDDLLDVSRIARGRIELRMEPVDLVAVVHRSIRVSDPLIRERGHECRVSLPPDPITITGDATRLEQIVVNLINNAAKYTEPSGLIGVELQREGREVVLWIRDNGIGIAPEMLARIFDPFVQADRRVERSQGGVGIGLTLVRKLAELHGGTVEAYSEGPGRGSEFVVRLPAPIGLNGERRPPAKEPDRLNPASSRHRVLVVDDNVDAAMSLGMLLKLAGQEVRVAYDGPAALRQAIDFHPQLVLLDIGMPGMDGYEVCRRLRREDGLEKTTVVALTGWGQDEDRRRSHEAGFDHHIVKPVEPGALQRLLDDLPADGQPSASGPR